MLLYLMRHGSAVPEHVDPRRPLSEEGLREAQVSAHLLREAGLQLSLVLHSGKARAEETARIVAEALGAHYEPHEHLSPNDPPDAILQDLLAYEEDLMLVGHLPHLRRLASLILTGNPDREFLAFPCAAVLCLRMEEPERGLLEWMITPQLAPGSLGPVPDEPAR
jgi:phosphohistidine phosphatase